MRTILVILLLSTTLFANEFIKKADSLRTHRADNFNPETLIADSTNVNPAIDLLKKAVETTEGKEQEEAVWKLLRTYYFKGYYCTDNSDMKQLIYDQGKELGEKFLEKYPESPGINVWTAILWGVWGEEHGIVAAATSGVAGKMRDYCEKAIEVDPEWSNGAAYRILGRLHFKAPNIPFVLGWPDNDDSIENLEKARKIDPENLFIKQYLAETLYDEGEKEKAFKLMDEVLSAKEVNQGIVEDAWIKHKSKLLLDEWKKD